MSTRPYGTHGGLRIRQAYNKAVMRYAHWCKGHAPYNNQTAWRAWVDERFAALLATRQELIAEAERKQKESKRNVQRNRTR